MPDQLDNTRPGRLVPIRPPVRRPVYGTSARDALRFSARPFTFVTTPAERRTAWREARKILWPSDHPPGTDDRAIVRLSLLKLGRGVLTITDGRIGTREVRGAPRDVIEWLKFRVDLCWP